MTTERPREPWEGSRKTVLRTAGWSSPTAHYSHYSSCLAQQLKEEWGLDHLEGRSGRGWHPHVTMVMLAHWFLRLEQKRRSSKSALDIAASPTCNPVEAGHLDRAVSVLRC